IRDVTIAAEKEGSTIFNRLRPRPVWKLWPPSARAFWARPAALGEAQTAAGLARLRSSLARAVGLAPDGSAPPRLRYRAFALLQNMTYRRFRQRRGLCVGSYSIAAVRARHRVTTAVAHSGVTASGH